MFNKWIGNLLFKLGLKPKISTGIGDIITCGYGKLDSNGYWQFPVISEERRLTEKHYAKLIN